MCEPAIVKEREKNSKKLPMQNVLNDQKYREILQNSKILHTQSKLQVEIFQLANFCSKRILLKSSKQRWFFLSKLLRDQTHHKLLPTFDLH